jgi:ribosomal protein S18 acetylase RimI-like enzyme
MITIRQTQESDFEEIWKIFAQIVQQGDTLTHGPKTTRDEGHAIWMSDALTSFVACLDGEVVGSYFLKANQPGLGSHVANAGYMVKGDARGKGIGRTMCEHSLEEARKRGFRAMQFNMVVSTNESAIALYHKMGFSIVGRLPKVFHHGHLGLVDAYVMHRFL